MDWSTLCERKCKRGVLEYDNSQHLLWSYHPSSWICRRKSSAFWDILLVIFTRQSNFAGDTIFAFHVLLVIPWMGLTWVFLVLCNIFACYQPSNSKSFTFYTGTTLSVAKACYAQNIRKIHIYVCLTCTCARVCLLSCVSVCLLSCVCVFDDVYACVCAFHDLCVCMSFFDLLQLACRLSQSGRMGHCLLCVCNGCT